MRANEERDRSVNLWQWFVQGLFKTCRFQAVQASSVVQGLKRRVQLHDEASETMMAAVKCATVITQENGVDPRLVLVTDVDIEEGTSYNLVCLQLKCHSSFLPNENSANLLRAV
jgi:hypothetical protein